MTNESTQMTRPHAFARASDSEVRQRVDRPAHEQSDLRVRSFELDHRSVEPLAQRAVMMRLVLLPAEQLLNIVFQSLEEFALMRINSFSLAQLAVEALQLRSQFFIVHSYPSSALT